VTGWRPLSQRGTDAHVSQTLYEGVPAHLRDPLLHWLECQFYRPQLSLHRSSTGDVRLNHEAGHARALRIANRLRLTLPKLTNDRRSSIPDRSLARDRGSYMLGLLKLAEDAEEARLLDIIDAVLAERDDTSMARWTEQGKGWQAPNSPEDLDFILRDGGSAYRVNDDGNALEQRVSMTVREAVRRATESSADKDGHLDAAWRAAYGIRPEPTVAYAEAVKAIEAAVIPVVLPTDPKATLGKALAHLRSTANQWELVISDANGAPAGVAPLVSLLELIWQGHRDRHAGTPTAIPVSSEAGEMAVHAAAMTVYWLSRNGLRRRGSS
jgi:hypothetical protein